MHWNFVSFPSCQLKTKQSFHLTFICLGFFLLVLFGREKMRMKKKITFFLVWLESWENHRLLVSSFKICGLSFSLMKTWSIYLFFTSLLCVLVGWCFSFFPHCRKYEKASFLNKTKCKSKIISLPPLYLSLLPNFDIKESFNFTESLQEIVVIFLPLPPLCFLSL